MAGKDQHSQQDELRQILFQDGPSHQPGNLFQDDTSYQDEAPYRDEPSDWDEPRHVSPRRPAAPGRPRGRVSQNRMRQFEKPPSAAPARSRPPVRESYAPVRESYAPAARRSSSSGAASWLLLVLVAVLLVAAGVLVYLLASGTLGGEGKATAEATSLPATGALLAQTDDAGDAYIQSTIFIGDSNFERLRNFGLVEPSAVAAKTGIGAGAITSDAFINVTDRDGTLTIAETMQVVHPRRMLVMMGTNDIPNMSSDDFIKTYSAALKELRAAAPDANIVVAAIPPVAAGMDGQALNAATVRMFNMALLDMCETEGFPFLDINTALAGPNGYLPDDITDDGFHLNQAALQALLEYYRTHAYNP